MVVRGRVPAPGLASPPRRLAERVWRAVPLLLPSRSGPSCEDTGGNLELWLRGLLLWPSATPNLLHSVEESGHTPTMILRCGMWDSPFLSTLPPFVCFLPKQQSRTQSLSLKRWFFRMARSCPLPSLEPAALVAGGLTYNLSTPPFLPPRAPSGWP